MGGRPGTRASSSPPHVAVRLLPTVSAVVAGFVFGCGSHSPGALPARASLELVPLVEGLEERETDEASHTRDVVDHAEAVQKVRYCQSNPGAPCCQEDAVFRECIRVPFEPKIPALRDAHPKHHGCVEATWEARSDVPAPLAQGVFAPGSRFRAWLRFSNGDPRRQADIEPDGRGIAIKLREVPGENLLGRFVPEPVESSQDFLLINHPVFFVPDIETYGDFLRANDSESGLRVALFFAGHLDLLEIAQGIRGHEVFSPLEIGYHSMSAYLLGRPEERRAVKYHVEPVDCATGAAIVQQPRSREARDFLREAMAERLDPEVAKGPACFDFSALVREDPNDETRPVEDPTVEWDLETTPRTVVARITVPPQSFESADQMSFCEDLRFTPWNSLPEHRPLGRLNRLRLEVYRAISQLRHALNRVETNP